MIRLVPAPAHASIPASSNDRALRVERLALRRCRRGSAPAPRASSASAGAGPRRARASRGDARGRAGQKGLVARLGGLEPEALGQRGAAGIGGVAVAHDRVDRAVERGDVEAGKASARPGEPSPQH